MCIERGEKKQVSFLLFLDNNFVVSPVSGHIFFPELDGYILPLVLCHAIGVRHIRRIISRNSSYGREPLPELSQASDLTRRETLEDRIQGPR